MIKKLQHITEKMKLKKKLLLKLIIFISAILILAIAGMLVLKKTIFSGTQNPFGNFGQMGTNRNSATSMVVGSGITSIGVIQEEFPIEGLTEGLEVEQVFVLSGSEVNTETAIAKFTDSSVASLRETLEKALHDAELAYRSGKIEYEQAIIQAESEYQTTLLNGKYAEDVYQETIAGLEDSVEEAKTAYEDAKAELTEFETNLANGTYTANLERWQKSFDYNCNLLVETMNTWGFQWGEVTSGRRGNQWGATEREQYLQASQDMYDSLEIIREYLNEAEADYDEKVKNADGYRQLLNFELLELEEAYAIAQANYETSLVQANLTRETSLAEAKLAQKNYETNLEKAESDLEILEESFQDAEENLTVFEEQMGTGYYYPQKDGTVLRVSLRAGREITSGSTVLMLSDYEKMTVTVSVDQQDISKISVGDSATVYSEDAGSAKGIVKSINPVSNSSGRNSITYSVTVEMNGTTPFGNNESVYVYFMTGGNNDET